MFGGVQQPPNSTFDVAEECSKSQPVLLGGCGGVQQPQPVLLGGCGGVQQQSQAAFLACEGAQKALQKKFIIFFA
jgi:hypothetical protein